MIPRAFQFFSKLRADAATAAEHVISIGHLVATSPHPALCRVPFSIYGQFLAIIRRFLDEGALGLASWPLVVSRARRICARTYKMRAPKERRGENTSGVFGMVFVRKRNVISHVILLFSRDCHMIALTLSPE